MPRRKRERIHWWHVLASAAGLVAVNLLLRLGLRRPARQAPQGRTRPRQPDVEETPRVVDHTPVAPEPLDARVGPVVGFGVVLLLFFGLVTAAVSGLQWLQTGSLPSLLPPAGGVDDLPGGQPPPEPRLDVLPHDTLASVRATEAALLDYGWADQAGGVARLPVERAMELIARRGLPVAAGAENRHYDDVVPVVPSDSSSGRQGEKLWP
jgi:hypothetical protein